ncbi:34139_t:CDS:2 [Gigaspora margarita]|uniref:34139_t:CDS:1 n=1 Tax=Gigaspora margarita TaxID=4874 RepID=A0ABM8W4X3_GIGMA|nr:34139_t:CDS:2 [Gigaspora margarita]
MEVLVEHDRLKNWEKLKGGESSSKNEKQTGERSSNKVLQERLSNGVKRARTEKLIDISPWVKYTKGEMNLQLEPDYFVKREKGSSILSEQVRKQGIRAKEEGKVDVPTRVKWVMTEEIECSPREFIKQLLTTATRAEWAFNQGLYDEIHQKRVSQKNWKPFFALMKRHSKLQSMSRKENSAWSFRIKCINKLLPILRKRQIHNPELYQDVLCRKCKKERESFKHLSICPYDKEVWIKKEEEILKSIKEELRQKDKIALGLDKLREVFIPRDIKEGFLADKIGSSLERINISKNKARDIAVAFLDEWLTFFQREIWKECCLIVNEWKKNIGIT